jgi:hypothetical protein
MSATVLTPPMTASEALALLDEHLSLSNVRMKLADPRRGRATTLPLST